MLLATAIANPIVQGKKKKKSKEMKHTLLCFKKCPCNPLHAYLEVSPTMLNGAYLQISVNVMNCIFSMF